MELARGRFPIPPRRGLGGALTLAKGLLGRAWRRLIRLAPGTPPPRVPGIPWRLPFPVDEPPAPPGVAVEELRRDEVTARLGESPEALDRLAPEGWRAFAALSEGRVMASSLVMWTRTGALLFRAHTPPEHRGRRLFALVARTIAWHLSREQVGSALRSSCARDNERSIRAHEAAGFQRQENTTGPDV